MRPQPLGKILKSKHIISQESLSDALSLQRREGGRLGDILLANGILNYKELYSAVADHYQLTYVNLLNDAPDKNLLKSEAAADYIAMRAVPWKKRGDTTIIAAAEFSEAVIDFAKQCASGPVEFVCTSPFDIRRSVETLFAKDMERQSRNALLRKNPEASARNTLTQRQRKIFYLLLLCSVFFLGAMPSYFALMLFAVCHVTYALTMCFKQLVFMAGGGLMRHRNWDDKLAQLDVKTLPIYTVLLPMYREPESLGKLLQCMQAMDYPASKLDIKLVLEEDDELTLQAAQALKPRYQFDIIRVPEGTLRTKPRACNYALRFARGELVTIYDADDRPDPQQLKKAVLTFAELPDDVACLQARLNYFNANENMLTHWFSLEYTILFHFLLHGLQRMHMPLPLGGTSNHIALGRLKELGEWDPYNVTEDADLGARLAARGLKTAMLDSHTMEEAPTRVWPWLKQRTRWIKGYMQTWLVHMRHPRQFYRNVGLRGFIGFQCFIGLPCFTFITAPIVWGLSILWVGQLAQLHSVVLPNWLVWLTALNLVINVVTQWYQSFCCAVRYRRHRVSISIAALLYPFYLVLHSIASYRALWQLIVKPHFWDKTMHGVAKGLYSESPKAAFEPVKSRV